MSVRINIEIGHEAAIRSKRTVDGFTHDWEIFVRGCENADIHCYIEKVIFHLHDTFPNPKRVIKEPPYRVRESGYAGFTLPIDIYLRNIEEPKKICFTYDLNLQPTGPAIFKVQKEKYVFMNPNEDFRHKLLKGGGISSGSSSSDSARDISSSSDKLSNKIKSSSSDVKKHRVKEHRQEDSFTNLFGTPITKTSKKSPDPKIQVKTSPVNIPLKLDKVSNSKKSKSKHSPKDKDRDKEKKDKSQEKKHKEEKKSKDRSKDKERKDKTAKKDRSPKQPSASPSRSPKRERVPSPKRPPSPPPIKVKPEEKKIEDPVKEKIKSESKKSKHEQKDKEKDKEKKEHKSHKEKDITSRKSEQKEHKSIIKEIKPPKEPVPVYKVKEKPVKQPEEPAIKEPEKVEKPKPEKIEIPEKSEKPEKPKHKHKKKDSKEKKEKKEEKSKEKKAEKKAEKSEFFERAYKEELKDSPKEIEKLAPVPKIQEPPPDRKNKEKSRGLNALQAELLDDSSNSSLASHDESSVEAPAKPVLLKPEQKKKEKTKSDQPETKRKRKHETAAKEDLQPPKLEEPPPKITRDEPEIFTSKPEKKKENSEEELPQDYMSILRELQHKIMTLQDNDELQQVVQLIAETGQFEITAQTFDFDLCALDRDTVRRLQEFFAIS